MGCFGAAIVDRKGRLSREEVVKVRRQRIEISTLDPIACGANLLGGRKGVGETRHRILHSGEHSLRTQAIAHNNAGITGDTPNNVGRFQVAMHQSLTMTSLDASANFPNVV
jgi:hypothetical protein